MQLAALVLGVPPTLVLLPQPESKVSALYLHSSVLCSNQDAGRYLYQVDDGSTEDMKYFSLFLFAAASVSSSHRTVWGARSSHRVGAKKEKVGFFPHFSVLWLLVSPVLKLVTQKLISAILKNVSVPTKHLKDSGGLSTEQVYIPIFGSCDQKRCGTQLEHTNHSETLLMIPFFVSKMISCALKHNDATLQIEFKANLTQITKYSGGLWQDNRRQWNKTELQLCRTSHLIDVAVKWRFRCTDVSGC